MAAKVYILIRRYIQKGGVYFLLYAPASQEVYEYLVYKRLSGYHYPSFGTQTSFCD